MRYLCAICSYVHVCEFKTIERYVGASFVLGFLQLFCCIVSEVCVCVCARACVCVCVCMHASVHECQV